MLLQFVSIVKLYLLIGCFVGSIVVIYANSLVKQYNKNELTNDSHIKTAKYYINSYEKIGIFTYIIVFILFSIMWFFIVIKQLLRLVRV